MAEMRSRRSPISPAEQRRRGQLGLERRYNHELYYVQFFINKTLLVDAGGKIHCRAYMDNFRDSAFEPEGIYVGARYAGLRILELDPNINTHALVLKQVGGNPELINNNANDPVLVHDWWLLLHARHSYFIAFLRTLRQLRILPRRFIQDESDRLPVHQFNWGHVVRIYLDQHCPTPHTTHTCVTQQLYPSPGGRRPKSNQPQINHPVVYAEFRDIVNNQAYMPRITEFERFIWNTYLDNINLRPQLTRIIRQYQAELRFTLTSQRTGSTMAPVGAPEGAGQRVIYTWTLTRE
ncbi:hypothetical protein BDC45DRAFT_69581 [Circinella umbellata]|nr:hypothetical protein BDC45DRAFT_69581 [Circinella umbellata]